MAISASANAKADAKAKPAAKANANHAATPQAKASGHCWHFLRICPYCAQRVLVSGFMSHQRFKKQSRVFPILRHVLTSAMPRLIWPFGHPPATYAHDFRFAPCAFRFFLALCVAAAAGLYCVHLASHCCRIMGFLHFYFSRLCFTAHALRDRFSPGSLRAKLRS